MSWIRRQQDIASLFAVWALLLQILLGPIGMATHAFGATSLGGIICTSRGLVSGPGASIPKPGGKHDDCFGCAHACRTACGMTPATASSASDAKLGNLQAACLAFMGRRDGVMNVETQSEVCSRAPPS